MILEERNPLPKLFGYLHVTQEWEELCTKKYPSLYCDKTAAGILTGPLSLVNHSCVSSFGFTKSITTSDSIPQVHAVATIACARLSGGSELLVNYGIDNNPLFECSCLSCKIKD